MNTDKARPPIFVRATVNMNHLRQFGARLGALFCAVCVLLPSPADAQCRTWDVSGQWKLRQGTDLVVSVNLRQNGKVITGTASGVWASLGEDNKETHKGGVAGTLEGSNITLDMDWDDGSGGIYRGVIGQTAMIKGSVIIDKRYPGQTRPWISMQPMKCADDGAKPKVPKVFQKIETFPKTTPKPTPGEDRGFIQMFPNSEKPATNQPQPPASGTAPTITANPTLVTVPAGQTTGTTTLSWDAGKDHPYAEVWVQVDGGDERKIVEQGKGSRQVQVRPGKTYLYILTDSGQRLATTTVKVK